MRLTNWDTQRFRFFQIIRMEEAGFSRQQMATALVCSLSWISKVLKQARLQGKDNVKPKGPAPGYTPALQAAQLENLKILLTAEAMASGFDTDGWTCKQIVRVVEEQYGVKHSPSHISRILHKIGFTLQKPQGKDYRRDETAVQQWKEAGLVEAKKKQ
jgi:transposase